MSKAKEKYYKQHNLTGFPPFILDYVQELEQQNKEMKCCGNCKHYISCTYDKDICNISNRCTTGDNRCDNWEELG